MEHCWTSLHDIPYLHEHTISIAFMAPLLSIGSIASSTAVIAHMEDIM